MMQFYMPPGLYTIGDPCYYFNDLNKEAWEHFLLINNFPGEGFLDQEETSPVCVFETYYGDGTYNDNNSNEYGVDSGLLGIMPYNQNDRIPFSHTVVKFTDYFLCSEEKGVLTFGYIIINTRDGNEEVSTEENEEEEHLYDEY